MVRGQLVRMAGPAVALVAVIVAARALGSLQRAKPDRPSRVAVPLATPARASPASTPDILINGHPVPVDMHGNVSVQLSSPGSTLQVKHGGSTISSTTSGSGQAQVSTAANSVRLNVHTTSSTGDSHSITNVSSSTIERGGTVMNR